MAGTDATADFDFNEQFLQGRLENANNLGVTAQK
jgi:hypothetical protein